MSRNESITFAQLKNKNFNKKGISNCKLTDCTCITCGKKFSYSSVKKFLHTRQNIDKKNWEQCQSCWLAFRTGKNPVWIANNRASQLIAQNKPEQKRKNAIGVSKSWTKERRQRASTLLKNRIKNDAEFRKITYANISWTDGHDPEKYQRIMSKSIKIGGLKGRYQGIHYESGLELSFIMWCQDLNIPIKRYDEPGIKYVCEQGKNRHYIPDFIINNDEIVEIKGLGLYYQKNYKRNILKIQAGKALERKYLVIFSNDKILTTNYVKARRWHHANQKQKND